MKIVDKYYQFLRWLDRKYWAAKNYLTGKRYDIVKLGISNNFIDCDFRLEKALEVLFLEFIQKELPFERANFESDEESRQTKKDLLEILNFFKVERAGWVRKIENLNNLLHEKRDKTKDWLWSINNPTEEETKLLRESMKLEEEFENRKTEIYKKIIDVRRSLWT